MSQKILVADVLASIRSRVCVADSDVSKTLSRIVAFLLECDEERDQRLVQAADIAVAALCTTPPNASLANEILAQISVDDPSLASLRFYQRWRRRFGMWLWRRSSPAARVLLGLCIFLSVMFVAGAAVGERAATLTVLGVRAGELAPLALCGALGGIVSILVRLRDFHEPSVRFRLADVFVGVFKPVVGIGFALFTTSAYLAGMIPLRLDPQVHKDLGLAMVSPELYFLFTLSFLAGFSERFVRDVVTRTSALS